MFGAKRILAGISFTLLLVACEQIPSHIIAPEQMEDLLVDIHKAEAISDNMPLYATTDARERLRQSVLDRHEVTLAQFDTSLVWYSEHMTRYSQIYDNVSARLRDEDNAVKTLLVERKSSPLTRPGDSIDVWNKEPYFMFEPRLYRHILQFNVLADDNFRENDIFQLSMNFAKLPQGTADKVRVTLVIRHRNDSIYTVSKEITRDGKITLEAQAQNNRVARVMGSIEIPLHPSWQECYVDKISLLRIRYKNRPNVPKP